MIIGPGMGTVWHVAELRFHYRMTDRGGVDPISFGAVNDNPTIPTDRPGQTGSEGPTGSLLDRRRVLIAGLGGLGVAGSAMLLGACGSGEGSGDGDTVALEDVRAPQLVPLFPRDVAYLAAGIPSRLIFTVTDDEGIPRLDLPEKAGFTIRQDDEQIAGPIEAVRYSEDIPRPYLGFTFTFPEKGIYDIYADVDGKRLNAPVIVVDPDEVRMPVIGEKLPSAPTATEDKPRDVDPICTLVPQCPFHEHDLEDVLGTGRPVVVLLATPAYCQTTACGPILENLMAEAADLPDDVVVIHSEVYKNAAAVDDINDAALAPLPEIYNMAFEPSLFVTDSEGILVARGDIAVDRVEMRELLALAR